MPCANLIRTAFSSHVPVILAIILLLLPWLNGKSTSQRPITSCRFPIELLGDIGSPGVVCDPPQDLQLLLKSHQPHCLIPDLHAFSVMQAGDSYLVLSHAQELCSIKHRRMAPEALKTLTVRLNLNQATVQDFTSLPGIGPKKAANLVAYRTRVGRFKRAQELLQVSGIGPHTFAVIKSCVFIE